VAKRVESLGEAWRRVTWTMSVILAAMDTSALDLSIGATSKMIERLWRGGVSKAETLDGAWRRD
jgi:hypothetical protein